MSSFEKITYTFLNIIGNIICGVVAVGLPLLLLVELYGLVILGINALFDANLFNPFLALVEATGGFPQGSFYR